MGARWYDPEAGRFLSIDPVVRSLADPGSLNPYAYAENDPLGAVDPSGASVIFTYRQIDSEGNTAFEITLQAESTSDLGSLASSVAERGGQVSLDGVDITKQLVAPGAVSSPAPSVPPPAGGPSGSSKAPADSPHEPTSGSAGRDTAFVDSGVYPSDEGSSWAGESYLVAELVGPRRTRIGEGGRFAGLGAAYASQLAVAEGGALAAAGVAGLEVVRNSLRAAAALASARAVLGLTVRQAVLAGAVAGPAVVIGVAAGLYVTGFAIENGIRLYNERTGSDWTTPNAILGRRLFPVIE